MGICAQVLASLSKLNGYSVTRQRVGLVGEGYDIGRVSLEPLPIFRNLVAAYCLMRQPMLLASPAYIKKIWQSPLPTRFGTSHKGFIRYHLLRLNGFQRQGNRKIRLP